MTALLAFVLAQLVRHKGDAALRLGAFLVRLLGQRRASPIIMRANLLTIARLERDLERL